MAVDLSRIREILDICSPSLELNHKQNDLAIMPQTTASCETTSSQWVRLSRRPSVDQPDESASPTQCDSQTRRHISVTEDQDSTGNVALHTVPVTQDWTASVEPHGFPADLFFNGISQDVSSWWDAFDTYDPDCPSF